MTKEILKDGERRMQGVIENTKQDFATVRTGRANPALLDRIQAEYYGTMTPLNQMASISAPEARLLLIQPWDKSAVKDIERAIQKSDLGLTPNTDGEVIRIPIPALTEERRKELVRFVRKAAEDNRIAVRNIRRDANDSLRSLEKEGDVSEDDRHRAEAEVQELTDKFIEEIDKLLKEKEAEIMEV
ncbi:MAG: ribosome recycling factor [Firmicutes bacterium]|nr:ribosome recycling factor [Bacillota bacterium]